jgi:phosphatidylethanolamine-binding protein (PEBP) family uncharacterized protein
MSKRLFYMAAAICFIGCVACTSQGPALDTSQLQKIGVDYRLTEQDICKDGRRSPEITVADLPAGVVSYDVKMTDVDSPGFRHWNETIRSQEPTIPAGRGAHYLGPGCPPNGHRYRISVIARNRQQEAVAYGEKTIIAERGPGAP